MHPVLLWFKQDLRLDDHPAMQAALEADRLLPVYVLDPDLLQRGPLGARRLGVHRARFLLESLAALDGELRQRGSRLLVLPGRPAEVLASLAERFAVQEVLTLEEIAPQERRQLAEVRTALGLTPLRELPGNGLLRLSELPCALERLPQVFSAFRGLLEQRPLVFQPRPPAERLPALPEGAEALFVPLPSLSQLGLGEPLSVPASAFPFAGGEPAARARLRDYLWTTQAVREYESSRNGLIGTEYSSKLSPWLANGSLSPRRVMAELRRYEGQYGSVASTRRLAGELLWREFFRWALVRHGEALFRADGVKATEGDRKSVV